MQRMGNNGKYKENQCNFKGQIELLLGQGLECLYQVDATVHEASARILAL